MSDQASNPTNAYTVPSVSITTARTGASSKANELGMRAMQERAYAKRGEQYLLIKSPPASGKSRALMFIALDKLNNQGLQQSIVVVPERSIGGSFADEPLTLAAWMQQLRLELCMGELRDARNAARTITDIAFGCGFSNSAHFSRAFRAHVGCSPCEYRQRIQ